MTTTFSLSPLFRSTVGFDRFNDLFESLRTDEGTPSYPPYNIEKHGEDRYGITMAVAGFGEDNLTITVHNDRITVAGRKEERSENEGVDYLYRGIGSRAFERTFRLDDHMKVTGAELKDGMLKIALMREVPEEQKPRTIAINGKAAKTIEHRSDEKKKVA